MTHPLKLVLPFIAMLALGAIAQAQTTPAPVPSVAAGHANTSSSKDRGSSTGQATGPASDEAAGIHTRESATENVGSNPAPGSGGTGIRGAKPAPGGKR
jgi:hypothetical protein